MADEEKVVTDGKEDAPQKVSRREFLVGAGATAMAGGFIALRPPETVEIVREVEKEVKITREVAVPGQVVDTDLPASMRAVTLKIDGTEYDVVVDVRESLWETMTNTLGLGSRINLGCDRAQCGACAVLIDGRSINGCVLLSARLGRGQEILTVKGITSGDGMVDLHPVQEAFIDRHGSQCAICSRGFIMSTYALLSQNPNPTEDDVRKALEGNICRCGNYSKVFDSVFAAAEAMG